MKSEGIGKAAVIALALSLVVYVAFFSCDSHLRHKNGPWVVRFGLDSTNPAIVIDQAKYRIAGAKIVFEGEIATNASNQVISFDQPYPAIPFGQVVFHDPTYLPGSVTFNIQGHQVELLPRTLIINQKERPWASGQTIVLRPGEKLPPDKLIRKKKK